MVAGPTKCGTSSLFEWLRTHPQTCGSKIKETRFFIDPSDKQWPTIHGYPLDYYQGYFSPKTNERVLFEASPQYYESATALDWLPRLASEPKILFVLREPANRLKSIFRYMKYFGHSLPESMTWSDWLETERGKRETDLCDYGKHLRPWQDSLGSERMKIWVFEDLVASPKSHMQELSRWLEIDPEYWNRFEFVPRNQTIKMHSPKLHKLATRLDPVLPNALISRLIPLYYRVIGKPAPRPDQAELQQLGRLRQQFKPQYALLAKEYSLDLGHWEAME